MQSSQTTINTNDLTFMVQLIDIAAQRGTFRPDEYEQIGAFYNKLLQIIMATQPEQPPTPETK